MHDVWEDINFIAPTAKERTGYPTQKPLALLERIIKASSNENDIVLDPFCGCATACVAAEKLQRQWIGIDISPSAEVITKLRLEEASQQGTLFSPIQMSDVTVSSTSPSEQTTQMKSLHNRSYPHIRHINLNSLADNRADVMGVNTNFIIGICLLTTLDRKAKVLIIV